MRPATFTLIRPVSSSQMQEQSVHDIKLRKCVCGQFLLPGMVPRPGPELEASITLWVNVGNLGPLEQTLLAGYGHLLEGRSSRLPRVANFLRNLPLYQARIRRLHEAASEGKLTELARLLEEDNQVWATSRDQIFGTTPLQKAMLAKHFAATKLILRRVPCSLHVPDRMGRTPLHYAAALDTTTLSDEDSWHQMLIEAGADENVQDLFGRTPEFYRERCSELLHQIEPSSFAKQKKDKEKRSDEVIIFHVTVEIREEDPNERPTAA